MDWGAANAAAIVDQGSPLGKTKRASAQGVSDSKNALTGYVIVQAESHEAAARLFESHPHFAIFPGDSVEIMECLPLPGHDLRAPNWHHLADVPRRPRQRFDDLVTVAARRR